MIELPDDQIEHPDEGTGPPVTTVLEDFTRSGFTICFEPPLDHPGEAFCVTLSKDEEMIICFGASSLDDALETMRSDLE